MSAQPVDVLRRMRSWEFVRLDRATKAEGRANANARIDALDAAIESLQLAAAVADLIEAARDVVQTGGDSQHALTDLRAALARTQENG